MFLKNFKILALELQLNQKFGEILRVGDNHYLLKKNFQNLFCLFNQTDNKNITYNYRKMASSTESKLKSKYESSTKKIQELYVQFSNIRKHISTPSKRNKNQIGLFIAADKQQQNSVNYSFQAPIPRSIKSRELFKSDHQGNSIIQNQAFFKNAIIKQFTGCFIQMDKRLDQKITLTQVRLQNLKALLVQFTNFYKIKEAKIRSKYKKCKCTEVQLILKQVEKKYEKKISQMSSTYESKISLLVKEHQQTSDSSNSKQIPKQIKDQFQKLEDKLILKEQQITSLKIQSSRLRKTLDNHKVLVEQKQSLIEELTTQIKSKQLKLMQLSKVKIQKLTLEEIDCSKCQHLEDKLKTYKKQIQAKQKQIKQLELKLQTCAKDLTKKQDHPKRDLKHCKSWCQSQILEKELVVSDYEEEAEMVENIKGNDDKYLDNEPLRHTQFFNSNKKKNSFKYEQKIKQLQIQLQLVLEQNKFLKSKKDKFQQQCKENESDQQKFQMQCQILRDQLKSMNMNLRILDQCAIGCLKQKKPNQQTVEKLSDIVKFKQEYFKKHPRKKLKSVKA